ncbi:MAG: acyltransferase domain-containing protein, partial [bacterium]|nr:acyltransferase domain-containing protein [bacterium]
MTCSTTAEAVIALSDPMPGKAHTFVAGSETRQVVFMFPGLGSQYVNMGLQLYLEEPLFRREMDRCFKILAALTEINIKGILYPDPADPGSRQEAADETIQQMEIAQSMTFIFEYALAKMLIQWGIKPDAMIGYSFGEYAAACISGVFSLEDALKLIVSRGRMVKKIPFGSML